MPEKEFWIHLFFDQDDEIELYFRIRTRGKLVHDFALQLVLTPHGGTSQNRTVIRRYHCAHGYAHCDVCNQHGKQVAKIKLADTDYNEAFTFAKADLERNAHKYLNEYRRS